MAKETDIQKAICDYLSLRKHFFWRSNNTPISQIENGKRVFRKMSKYAVAGVPDIIVIKDGFFIGLEVKQDKGRQSDGQKEFEKMCKNAGGEYYVVRSIDDVQNVGL